MSGPLALVRVRLNAVCRMQAVLLLLLVVGVSRLPASPLTAVPGIPGQDYPTLDFYNIPLTSFTCDERVNAG